MKPYFVCMPKLHKKYLCHHDNEMHFPTDFHDFPYSLVEFPKFSIATVISKDYKAFNITKPTVKGIQTT